VSGLSGSAAAVAHPLPVTGRRCDRRRPGVGCGASLGTCACAYTHACSLLLHTTPLPPTPPPPYLNEILSCSLFHLQPTNPSLTLPSSKPLQLRSHGAALASERDALREAAAALKRERDEADLLIASLQALNARTRQKEEEEEEPSLWSLVFGASSSGSGGGGGGAAAGAASAVVVGGAGIDPQRAEAMLGPMQKHLAKVTADRATLVADLHRRALPGKHNGQSRNDPMAATLASIMC
jgi:hypothetical protein